MARVDCRWPELNNSELKGQGNRLDKGQEWTREGTDCKLTPIFLSDISVAFCNPS